MHLPDITTGIAISSFFVITASDSLTYDHSARHTGYFGISNLTRSRLQNTGQIVQIRYLTENAVEQSSRIIPGIYGTSRTHQSDIAAGMISTGNRSYLFHIGILYDDCFSITDVASGITDLCIAVLTGCGNRKIFSGNG